MKNKEIYANHSWWINVVQYYQVGSFTGKRWRMCYDDTFIADYDHKPTMTECMDDLVKWWENESVYVNRSS